MAKLLLKYYLKLTKTLNIDKILSMIDLNMLNKTPNDIGKLIASRVKKIRKRKKITQEELSERSGVSYGSIKRFERTGEISFISLIKISKALGIDGQIEDLFERVPYDSIEEIIREQHK